MKIKFKSNIIRMKAKKENKLGSTAEGELTDLNGIGCDHCDDDDNNHGGGDDDDDIVAMTSQMTQEGRTQVNTATRQETAFQVELVYTHLV